MKNKALTSKILGFISMALSIISIPMLFLPIIGSELISITLIDVLKISDFLDEYESLVILPICCIIVMVMALAGGIFIALPKKGFKISGGVVTCIAFIASAVILIFIMIAANEAMGLFKPGVGLWVNTILLLISTVLSITAAVTMPKNAVFTEIPPIGGGPYAPPIPVNPPMMYTNPTLTFLSGSCAGYQVPVNGANEIIIGKDPAQCSIVIDKKYEKVSRKHCGVRFDAMQNIYIVTDYSTNGTMVVGGSRLARGSASYLEPGTTINLAKTENSFRLD